MVRGLLSWTRSGSTRGSRSSCTPANKAPSSNFFRTLLSVFTSCPTLKEGVARNPGLVFWGLDVSHSGEASYLMRRVASRAAFPYTRLVVDVGASDGLLSSNSFNFLQWGWSAILVEPQAAETSRIQYNVARYVDPYREGNQTITIVQAVMGRKNGVVQFALTDRSLGMESHVVLDGEEVGEDAMVIYVPSITVKTFAQRYKVPNRFGILSVDAEGLGDDILHMWIDEGFTPAYIIYENLHNGEPLPETILYLKVHGYKYLASMGWNHIFEHVDPDTSQ